MQGIGKIQEDTHTVKSSNKLNKLLDFVERKQVDIVGMAEVNKDWRMMGEDRALWKIMKSYRIGNSKAVVANNRQIPQRRELQWGGTAMVCVGDITASVHGKLKNRDPRGLGRWTEMTIDGKEGTKTTFITCYCPNASKSGEEGVPAQQQVYINQHGDIRDEEHVHYIPPEAERDPRKLFWIDLDIRIKELQEMGRKVFVMGDFNSEYSEVVEWMELRGLADLIAKKHGKLPRTCKKSKNDPIDAIFGPEELEAEYCGFLSFSKLGSDHRGIWMDVCKEKLNCLQPKFVPPEARRLVLKDPRVVQRYVEKLEVLMLEAGIYQRIEQVYNNAVYPLPAHLQREYEAIDRDIVQCQEEAEKSCRKLHKNKHPHSPILDKAMQIRDYWNKRYSRVKKEKFIHARTMINMQRRLGIVYKELSVEEVEIERAKARARVKELKKNSKSLHYSHRYQLAAAKEAAGEGKLATIIRSQLAREKQKEASIIQKHIFNKNSAGSTSKVWVTQSDGSLKEYTKQEDMERVILNENEKKYHQTEGGSQLLDQEYVKLLGNYGEGPATASVLDGTFIFPEGTSQSTREFIEACKELDEIDIPPYEDSLEDHFANFVRGYNIRKEKTCTYAQHLGHFKAAMKSELLRTILFMRAEIPVLSGYSPERWKTCLDLMILKKLMEFRIEKLRTLGILAPDFNQHNKTMQKEAIYLAIQKGAIAPEQYSRPGRDCKDHALNRRLTLDQRQYDRKCWSLAMSDLTGCYDRIVHSAATLALLRVGVSKTKVFAMFETIQKMVHRTCTAFGESKGSYGGSSYKGWRNAPQGVLQGNAAGPVIWSILSSVIFTILREQGFCDSFCMCLSKETFQLLGFAFVDDADLIQSGDDAEEVMGKMQDLLDQWRDLMEVTGGALETKKTYYTLIDYKRHKGDWKAFDPDVGDRVLSIRNDKNKKVILQRLKCSDAQEMLGVWLAMDGNNERQVAESSKAVTEWASKLRKGRCSAELSWNAYCSTICRKVEYVLLPNTFTKENCTKIMTSATRLSLQRAGYSANLITSLRDASVANLGTGATSMHLRCGVVKVSALLFHHWKQSPTQDLLQSNVQAMVLEMGLYGDITASLNMKIGLEYCAKHSWISYTLNFMKENGIQAKVKHYQLEPARQGDKSIMQVAYAAGYRGTQLAHINAVRMHNNLVSISDLCNASGTKLNRVFYHRSKFRGQRNKFLWPRSHSVERHEWDTWMNFIFRIFPQGTNNVMLGDWIVKDDQDWLDNWDWFVTEDYQWLCFLDGEDWTMYAKIQTEHTGYTSAGVALCPNNRYNMRRATVEWSSNNLLVDSTDKWGVPMMKKYKRKIKGYSIDRPLVPWMFKFIETSDKIDKVIEDIKNGTAVAVGDGSYFEIYSICTGAWVISSADGSQWIKGGGVVPGLNRDKNSYRGEVASLTGIATCLVALAPRLGRATSSIVVASDNDKAVDSLWWKRDYVKSSMKSIDLITSNIDLWEKSLVQPIPTRVKGHADQLHRPLTFLEHLNTKVDHWAKEIAISEKSRPIAQDLHREVGLGLIRIGKDVIVSNLNFSIQDCLEKRQVHQYLSSLLEVPVEVIRTQIQWTCVERARKSRSFKQNRFITKVLANDLPVGSVLARRNHAKQATCPCCKMDEEDLLHFLTCLEHEDIIISLLDELEIHMRKVDTHPQIRDFILCGLSSWFKDPEKGTINFSPRQDFIQIAIAQNGLGWFGTLMGFFHKSLIMFQHDHYTEVKSRRTGIAWGKQMACKLWDIVYKLWTYRNSCLHETSTADELRGLDELEDAIVVEHRRGLRTLDGRKYGKFFKRDLDTLLKDTTQKKKAWFLLIRSARELDDDTPLDNFIHDDLLREWVGLTPIGVT